MTYGITPRFPATGYGYIRIGEAADAVDGIDVDRVAAFVEKPDAETAEAYLAEGCYRWNSGIFTWRVDVVRQALAEHVGWLSEALAPVGEAFGSGHFAELLAKVYPELEKISIDYALMENAETIHVVTADFDWDDVGSWDALHANHLHPDDNGVRGGDVLMLDCTDSLLLNEDGPLVAGIGLDNMIVVSTPDAVLVMPRGHSQAVKTIVTDLDKADRDNVL